MPQPSNFGLILSLALFTFVYGVVAILCCRAAVVQLRRVAMAQAGGNGRSREILARPVVPARRQ
jgi:hypothetical protein